MQKITTKNTQNATRMESLISWPPVTEAEVMQLLAHTNIPTILGVQLEQKPFSIVMEFIGEQHCSSTVHDLLQRDNVLAETDWIKISFNVADALSHMHKKGFLHCDLKTNNIVVSNRKGYLIYFGKACLIASPLAKKYNRNYPHKAPEVLHGSAWSKQSDVYSLGTVLNKIGTGKQISTLANIAKKCLKNSPTLQVNE